MVELESSFQYKIIQLNDISNFPFELPVNLLTMSPTKNPD